MKKIAMRNKYCLLAIALLSQMPGSGLQETVAISLGQGHRGMTRQRYTDNLDFDDDIDSRSGQRPQ